MRTLLLLSTLPLLAAAAAPAPQPAAPAPPRPQTWIADNGNGTYTNPLFYEEFEDPDITRVNDDYYLAGTTMHMNPALIVLHSKDLVNWQLASYCMDRLDLGPAFHLQGGDIYGQGIWAPCIRYHDGTFFIFSNVNGQGCQVFRSKSPNGPWVRNQLPAMHDLSVLFDDDAPGGPKIYAVYAATNVQIVELNQDLTAQVPGTLHPLGVRGLGEGHHLYKIKGQYFDVSALPGAHTDQVVARADSINGPWTVERMVQSESLGVPTQNTARNAGRGPTQTYGVQTHDPNEGGGLTIHQGGIVDTPSGQWWSIIMSDHGSVGRLVNLVPITWDNNFPIIGLPGNLRKAPATWLKPDTGHQADPPKPLFLHSDNFDAAKLNPVWQWNHAPDDTKWSLTENPGKLRLHSLPAEDFWTARNSLAQRAMGPESTITVELDGTNLQPGDTAGLALLNQPYAWIGLVKSADSLAITRFDQVTNKPLTASLPPAAPPPLKVFLRAACNFDTEKAILSYSLDNKTFTPLGNPFTLIFQLKTFQGIRYSLFNYNAPHADDKLTAPGFADFDNLTVIEPRANPGAAGIPLGKTISLSSVADGSYFLAPHDQDQLESVPNALFDRQSSEVQFLVVDLGQGRIALQGSKARFLSVAADGSTSFKTIPPDPTKPNSGLTNAESFQWVDLQHGHIMLMSLINHRYLLIKPNTAGTAITATSTGPSPDHKEGASFTWKPTP